MLDISGCTVEEILFYVSQGSPVFAMTGNNSAVLVTGYNSGKIFYYDPIDHTTRAKSYQDADKWFKFLGFNIKGDMITLSKNRVKKFQKEVESRSIKRKNCSAKQARNSIIKYLYEGDFSWATSCMSIINVEPDIQELNKFIMDCIRACKTGKKKIGGLGSVDNLPDKTILRGIGRNVKANRNKTGYIENYLSVGCLSKNLKMGRVVFEASVRSMR